MPFDVEMPDGTVIEGVPDGTSKDEIARRYAAMGERKAAQRSAGDKLAGVLQGAMPGMGGAYAPDVIFGARQTVDALGQMLGFNDPRVQRGKEAYEATAPDERTGAGLARGAGQALLLAPVTPAAAATTLPRALGIGGGVGGVSAALTPVYGATDRADFWKQKRDNVLGGVVAGAATGGAGHGLGRILAPETGAAQRTLLAEGVPLTPGQTLGGAFGRAEEGLSSVPVLGDMIRGARLKATEGFNRMAYNQALRPIGERVTKADPVGYAGVDAVAGKIGAAYDSALDKIKRVDIDPAFDATIDKLRMMADELGVAPQFEAIVKNQVLSKLTPARTMSAETMKSVESELGKRAVSLRRSSDGTQQELGKAVREVQTALRDAVERSAGPMAAKSLQNANKAWAEFVRIEDAASRVGSRDGIFTAEAFNSSVHKMAPGGRHQTGRGKALGQELATDALDVLGRKVPDSGTPYRGLAAALASGMIDPTIMAGGLAAMAPYTGPGRAATVAALTKRPELLQAAGSRVKELSPYLAPFGLAPWTSP
jgi:hypothetical protein